MVILDTNIIIDHLRTPADKTSHLVEFVQVHPKETLAISMMSVQELYQGKSTLKEEKEKDLLATLSPLKTLPYTYEVAHLAGIITRNSSNLVSFADAAIAATTIVNNGELYTLNTKHFSDIPNLTLL